MRRRRISRRRADATGFAFPVCSYELPLVCYPGQEASFGSKRANIARSLAACDGVVVGAGETFSFWRCAGRPTAARGYGSAAAMRDGVMGTEIGGAICFSATLLYNAGLLSGMEIAERWCHSVDTYGDARYFELGRDAAVEFAYRDLRMRNRAGVDLRIGARVELGRGVVEVWSAAPVDLDVKLDIAAANRSTDGRGRGSIRVCGARTITRIAGATVETMPVSEYAEAEGALTE